MEQDLSVVGDGGASVLRVRRRLLRREGEEKGAPPLSCVQVTLAYRLNPINYKSIDNYQNHLM